MIVVPRVLEKVYNAASQKAGHGAKGVAFAAALWQPELHEGGQCEG